VPVRRKRNKKLVIGTAIVTILLASGLLAWYVAMMRQPLKNLPLSRQVMLVAEEQTKVVKPAPPESARRYAYVATSYQEALKAGNQQQALYAAQQILSLLYPERISDIKTRIDAIAAEYKLDINDPMLSAKTQTTIAKYTQRNAADKHNLVWNGSIPTGQDKWRKTDTNPAVPRAGEWERWIVSGAFVVPPPPVFGSAQDQQELVKVQLAVAQRNGEDVNKINFWGGTPGTETPAGIWQNQLFLTVKSDLPHNATTADKKYAELQMYVAQSISDAFMECWKVKYTYWTARPDMRISGLKTAMKDPPFHSYISGHSTISKTAADVLSVLVPKHKTAWESMAVEARDSRLKAGIHFEIDNSVGFDLGTQVANQIIGQKRLSKIL